MGKIALIAAEEMMFHHAMEIKEALDNQEDLDIFMATMGEAVQLTQQLDNEIYDVIMARGESARLIQEGRIGIPLVEIGISNEEVMESIRQAEEMCRGKRMKAAFLVSSQLYLDLKAFLDIIDADFIYQEVNSKKEVADFLSRLDDDEMIVMGGHNICSIAADMGFRSVTVNSSKQSVERAFAEARKIQHSLLNNKYISAERRIIINAIHEGIISIDEKCRIITINDNAKRILGITEDVQERNIFTCMKQLSSEFVSETLETGKTKSGHILELCSKKYSVTLNQFIGANKRKHILITIQGVENLQRLEAKVRKQLYMKGNVATYQFDGILGISDEIKRAVSLGKKYASAESNILIIGETGTGKELFAQSIHNAGRRSAGPFVAVNCGAIPDSLIESELFGYQEGAFTGAKKGGKKGLFELAHGGTIFLDEISELNLYGQVILLRALQEKEIRRVGGDEVIPIDVRVIAACNKSLYQMVQMKEFRKDLFYRLSVLVLNIPPLRERRGDAAYIARHYIDEFERMYGTAVQMEESAYHELEEFSWDGNIRQLVNFCEKLVVMGQNQKIDRLFIRKELETQFFFLTDDECSFNEEAEHDRNRKRVVLIRGRAYYEVDFREMLKAYNGNKSAAAKKLGISRTSLWRYLKDLGIDLK